MNLNLFGEPLTAAPSTANQFFGNMHGGDTGKDEWLTPPEIIEALGEFDLDPCAPITRPWPTARTHFTVNDNGLAQPWQGRVWMNPPYGSETPHWMEKLALHGDGIALIFARTETKTFFPWIWERADAIFFFDKRIHFRHVDGSQAASSGGAPSCLIAYGQHNVQAIAEAIAHKRLTGKLLPILAPALPR